MDSQEQDTSTPTDLPDLRLLTQNLLSSSSTVSSRAFQSFLSEEEEE
jgi:hypothetical protein